METEDYKRMLTVIIVTFHSAKIIQRVLNAIDKDIKVIVIENSQDEKLKSILESKYKNVKVIIPKTNLGNGGGINLGFKNVSTKYSLYLDADTVPQKDMIEVLMNKTSEIKNFSILAPKVIDHFYDENLYIKKDKLSKCHKMNFITGCALLFNMTTLKKIGYFDENIFLYYEEHDLYFRCLKAGLDIYLIDEAKILHDGASGTDKQYDKEIRYNRNWHYCWSKFYYFRKNFNYIYGLKKTFPNLIKALRLYFFNILKGNKIDSQNHKAEIQGLFASYFFKKSSRRPVVNGYNK